MFVEIRNTPRDYAWGSHSLIADFLGSQPSGGPEAELWLGAHAGSPSKIVDAASVVHTDLAEWIAADPQAALGPELAAQGARLPFLLKVLAAAQPLSLQAHPTPERAREGFQREEADGTPVDAYDRNYRDPFHKPELIVAVTPFEALSGFRPLDEVGSVIEILRRADAASPTPDPGAVDLLAEHLAGDDPIRGTVEWLLRDGRGGDTGQSAWVVERVTALAASEEALASALAASFATVGDLATQYPGDPGIVISLLLNRVSLAPGEALYLAAGNIHAYLSGLGIELMAASDNVLRGGLTPKHIDVTELLEVLDATPIAPPRLAPIAVADGVEEYRPDVADFTLFRVQATADAAKVPLRGPAIAIAQGDAVHVEGAHRAVDLIRGDAVYITPDEGDVSVSGAGVLWIATTGRATSS